MIIFNEFISSLACPECLECSLFINENYAKKKGLASLISVNFSNCDFSFENYISQNITNDQVQGMKPFEINYRAVYALRTIGVRYSGLEKVFGMFNLPKPMTQKNYDAVSRILGNSAKMAAELSMMEAAEDLRKVPGITTYVGVSVDGTWQRRGYSSLNGAVAIISLDKGKIVDVEAMTRFCKPRQQKKETLSEDGFCDWYDKHKDTCVMNYSGSAPMMEVEGTRRIFERSVEIINVRYLKYFGDGDSKAFQEVKDVYSPDVVVKYECVGHYQIRVGCRLRKLKKTQKGLKALTESVIDKLQNYFGIALRANTGGTVQRMADVIWASFLHVASNESSSYHDLGEKSPTSWSQYQRDRFNNTNLFQHGTGLPNDVIAHVKPIYRDLIKHEQLKKCLHGKTQNHNESFNALIWERAPKSVYISIDKLNFAVYDAVAIFNDGRHGSLNVFKNVGIDPGYYTTDLCCILNLKRKVFAEYKFRNETKKRRKIIRAQKKKNAVAKKHIEGKTYKAGGF